MNSRNRIYQIIVKINNVAVKVAANFVLLLIIIVCYEVTMRYAFNMPTIWVLEVSGYVLLFIAFMAAGYTLQIDAHVSCDILVARLRPRTRRTIFLITAPFGLMFCVVLGWQVWKLFFLAYKEKALAISVLSTPLVYPYSIMIIGTLLLFLTYASNILEAFLKPAEQLSRRSDEEVISEYG